MESGVVFDGDYFDYDLDINWMGWVLVFGGLMDGFVVSLKLCEVELGSWMYYVLIDIYVLGMVIWGVIGCDILGLMFECLIVWMGLEVEFYYLIDGEGMVFVLGGLNLWICDYVWMGEMVCNMGWIGFE